MRRREENQFVEHAVVDESLSSIRGIELPQMQSGATVADLE